MILGDTLLRRNVAEYSALLLVIASHVLKDDAWASCVTPESAFFRILLDCRWGQPMRWPILAVLSIGFAAWAFGQELAVPVVAGHPFSGDEVTTRQRSVPNGIPVVPMETTRVYRDSAGRTRIDAAVPRSPVCCPRLVYIFDPIAGVNYFVSTEKKIASREVYAIPAGQSIPTADDPWKSPTAQPFGAFSEPLAQYEFLGKQLVSRLLVNGRRTSRVWTAASNGSTSRPAGTAVEESWYSPDLQMMLIKQVYATSLGFSTTQLENIDRSEPDQALFKIPADYKIVDGFVYGLADPNK